jgi:hypothetical protein
MYVVTAVSPSPNDKVSSSLFGARAVLDLKAIGRLTNIAVFNSISGCALNSSSTTYVNVTSASQAFTKDGDSSASDVIVLLALSSFRAVAGTATTFGVSIAAVDYDIMRFDFKATANDRNFTVGFRTLTGIGAGVYSVILRAKGSAANNMSIDGGDTVSMLIAELPK